MSTELAPFLKWSEHVSKDANNPDVLHLEVIDAETFETEYSTNVHVKQMISDKWQERVLPLKSHESNNTQLLHLWNKAKRDGKITQGRKFQIKTYLGLSKNNRSIRRFDLVF